MNFGGAGLTAQLTATGYYTHPGHPAETQNITTQVTWKSSATQCVTVSATGLITSGGNVCSGILVTASAPGFDGYIAGTMTVNVTQPASENTDIVSVSIIPAAQTVASLGTPVQYEAIGTTAGGLTVALANLPLQLKWVSSNTTVATINASTGLATAVGSGTSTISATFTNTDGTGAIGSTLITVAPSGSPEPLTAITIAPNTQTSSATGQTAQFLAIATTGSGTSVNLTNQSATINGKTIPAAVWTSSAPSIATINSATGTATAVSAGAAVITAIATNPDGSVVTGTATYTVSAGSGTSSTEPLLSVAIVPGTASAPAGQPSEFLAIGTFSASASTPGTQNLANVAGYKVTWYSSNPTVATVCAAPGPCTTTQGTVTGTPVVVTGFVPGVTAITAVTSGNPDGSVVTTTTTFTVTGTSTSAISGLTINPSAQSITMPEVGKPNPTVNLVVLGSNGSGILSNLTGQVTWTSSNPAVLPSANIVSGANAAVATAVGPGNTTITATYTNVSTAANPVSSVVTATATLTVTGPAQEPLLSLAINPSAPSVPFPTQTSQLNAIGTYSVAPVTQNLTSAAVWTSSNTSVATVCTMGGFCPTNSSTPTTAANAGLVTAVSQGTTAITATASNPDSTLVYATVPFAVAGGSTQLMTALSIVPDALTLSATGQPGFFIALGTSGSTGLQQDVTSSPQIAWTSTNPAIATVSSALAQTQTCSLNNATPPVQVCTLDPPGLVKGVSAGSTTITAEFTNPASGTTQSSVVTATANVTVTATPAAEPLLSINVQPGTVTVNDLLGTGQFLAFGTFSTAPTAMDITNGFFHAGFSSAGYPSSSCTAAYAAADAATAAADAAANPPIAETNLPDPQCSFVPVTWVSLPDQFIFPINSAGAPGAFGGLVTADGSGTADIYAVASNPDGTLVYSSSSGSGFGIFNCPYVAPTYATVTTTLPNGTTITTYDYSDILNIGSCNNLTIGNGLLSTLTVFDANLNSTGLNQSNWLITAPSATGTPDVIHCGPGSTSGGSVCEATYPNGTVVTLTATGGNFGGWSENCANTAPVTPTGPNSCTVVVGGGCTYNSQSATYMCTSSNVSVGAVFN